MSEHDEGECSKHPCAPHGFNRNASHCEDRYVCDCDGWSPDRSCAGLELQSKLQSEKARADAADSRIAALEAGMRDAEAKMRAWGDKEAGPAYAGRYYNCADELSALLNRPADGGE